MIADESRQINIQGNEEEGLFTEQPGYLAMNMDNFQSYSDKIAQALEESSQFTSFLNFDDVYNNNSNNSYGSYARTTNTEFEQLGREIANKIKEQAVIVPTDTTLFDLHTIEEDALNEEDISIEKQQGQDHWMISSQEEVENQIKIEPLHEEQDIIEYSDKLVQQTKGINCAETFQQQKKVQEENSASIDNSNGRDNQSPDSTEKEENENNKAYSVTRNDNIQEVQQENQQENEIIEVNDKPNMHNVQTDGDFVGFNYRNEIDQQQIQKENVHHRTTEDQLAQQWEQKDISLAHFLAFRNQQLNNNIRINDQKNQNVNNIYNYSQSKQQNGQQQQQHRQMNDQQKQKQQGAIVSYGYIQKQPGLLSHQQLNYQSKISALSQHKISSQTISQYLQQQNNNNNNKYSSLHMVIQQQQPSMLNSQPRNIKSDVRRTLGQCNIIDLEVDLQSQNSLISPKYQQNSQKIKVTQQTPNKTDPKYNYLLELQKQKLKEEKAKYNRAQKQHQEEKLFSKTSKTFHSSHSNDTINRQTTIESQIINRNNKSPNNDKNEYYLDYLNAQQGNINNNNNNNTNTNSSINSAQFEECQGSGYLNSYKLKKKQQSLSNLSSKALPVSPSFKKEKMIMNPYQLTRKIESPQVGSKSPNHRQQQPLDLNVIKKITQELSSNAKRKSLEQEAIQSAKAEREAKMLVQSGQVAEAINKMLLQSNLRPPQSIHKQPKSAPSGQVSPSINDPPVAIITTEKQEEKQQKLTKQRFQNVVSNFFTFHLNDQIPTKMIQPYEHLKANKHKQRAVLQLSENYGKQQDALEIKITAQQHRPKSGRPSTSTSAQVMNSEFTKQHFQKSKSFTQRSQQYSRNGLQMPKSNELPSQNNGSNNIQLKTLLL